MPFTSCAIHRKKRRRHWQNFHPPTVCCASRNADWPVKIRHAWNHRFEVETLGNVCGGVKSSLPPTSSPNSLNCSEDALLNGDVACHDTSIRKNKWPWKDTAMNTLNSHQYRTSRLKSWHYVTILTPTSATCERLTGRNTQNKHGKTNDFAGCKYQHIETGVKTLNQRWN